MDIGYKCSIHLSSFTLSRLIVDTFQWAHTFAANSEDLDEMPLMVAFYQGLHYLLRW